jgi:hypothetical protein
MMWELHRVCKPQGSVIIINHFHSTTQMIGRLAVAVTPLTRYLGWDASLRLSVALKEVPLRIERCCKTSPFSLFTVLVGVKPLPPEAMRER